MKESQSLGDKVKTAIAKEMKRNSRDRAKGDPVLNPYAFCFEYREDETPDKKYDAFRVDDLVLTPEIDKLISDTDAPDIGRYAGHYSPETLRSQLELACLIDGLPWDSFFSPEAIALLSKQDEDQAPKAQPAAAPAPRQAAPARGRPVLPPGRATASPARAAAPVEAPRGRPAPATRVAPAPAAEPEEEFECNGCDQIIKASETECRNCGHKYEVQAPVPAPAPARRKRSEAQAAPATATPSHVQEKSRVQDASLARHQAAPAARPARPQAAQRPAAPVAPGEPAAEEDPGFGEFSEEQIPF
jgi:hypothetical protein